jgi:arylsulfatase A-like enzyme
LNKAEEGVKLKSMERVSRHSITAVAISLITGLLLGLPIYSLWFYSLRSYLPVGLCMLAGACICFLLMRGLAWTIGLIARASSYRYEISASLAVTSLLVIYLIYPLYLFSPTPPNARLLMLGLLGSLWFSLYLVFAAGAIRRRGWRKLSAFLLVPVLITLGTGGYLLTRSKVGITVLPGTPLKKEPKPVRITFTNHSLHCLPLAVASALESEVFVPYGGLLDFRLGVVHPDRNLKPVQLQIIAVDDSGRIVKLYDKLVDRNRTSWNWHRVELYRLYEKKVLLKIQIRPMDQDYKDDKPLYVSGLRVFVPPDPLPPNVIILLFDALRADALGCYGSWEARTSVLDKLAFEGILFERALSPCSWTAPAVASILTSKMPSQHKTMPMLDWRYDSLPQLLSREGIYTGAVVSNPLLLPQFKFDKGFQDYYYESLLFWRNTEYTIDDAIRLIEDNRDRPFFLYVHVFDPHHPYFAPPPYGLRPSIRERTSIFRQSLKFFMQVPYVYDPDIMTPRNFNPGELEDLRDRYLAKVEYVSDQTDRLIRSLRKMKLWNRTILIITSDHGETFQEHGYIRHGQNLYREQIHVPLIFTGGIMEGQARRVSTPVSTLDLFPTVLDFQGARIPEDLQGRSLRGLIEGKQMEPRPVYSELVSLRFDHVYLSMVERDYHMIKKLPLSSGNQGVRHLYLYKWDQDPAEINNLYEAKSDMAQRMELKLDTYFDSLPDRDVGVDAFKIEDSIKKSLRAMGYLR